MKKIYSAKSVELLMVVVQVLMWAACYTVFTWLLPEYDFRAYHFIVALFLVFTLVIIRLTSVWDKKVQSGAMAVQKAVGYFMMPKVVKLLVSAAAVFYYVKSGGPNKEAFLLTFLIYYMVFLGLEIFAVYSFDKRHKQTDNC